MSSSVDREIRLTASDNGVFDRLNRLKEGALSMGRGIAEDARRQATSSRELIKLMNDEIALIEKRNKLNREGRELQAREKFSTGTPQDKASLKKEIERIAIESKEEKMQTELLKQILQSILKTSGEEITANRESVERQVASDKEIDTMEDHEEALRHTFQRQMLQDTEAAPGEKKEDAKRRAKSSFSSMGNFVQDTDLYHIGYGAAGNFMTSRAASVENTFGKRLLLAGGLIAGAAGIGISAATDQFEAAGDITRASGIRDTSKYKDVDKDLDLTTAQAMHRAAQLMIASGGKEMGVDSLRNILALERGFGVSGDVLARTSSFSRSSGVEAFGAGRIVAEQQGLHQSRTNELLQLQLQMTEKQFMESGKSDTLTNAGIINTILSGQQTKNVARAGATIQALDQVVQGGNEQLEALKFSEYQKKYGGGYVDYLREKELGASGVIDDVLIDRVLSSSMGKDDKVLSLHNMGLKISQADDIIRAGGVSPSTISAQAALAKGQTDASTVTTEGVGLNPVTQSAAAVTNGFAMVGEAAVELANDLGALLGVTRRSNTSNGTLLEKNKTANSVK